VARAMLAAADAAMARALRRVSVERGLDPRAMVLVAFGGGGPLHACGLAERLGMTRVLVPPHAGVLSAVGLAAAPARREALASVMRAADAMDAAALGAIVDSLAVRAGAGEERRTWVRARYAGQGHELEVPVQAGDDGAALASRFAELHDRRVGFTLPRGVEIVSARHAASTAGPSPRFARGSASAQPAERRGDGGALVIDAGGAVPARVNGPATIVLPDATVLVPAGWTARALDVGGWMVEAT
jgi:N-methylhydantoinase A